MVSSELLCRLQTRPSPSSPFVDKESLSRHARPSLTSPAQRRRVTNWSMDGLSTELLALILVQLRAIDSRSLDAASLVSKRLYDIATPIKYEILRLTPKIVHPDAALQPHEGFRNALLYTKHVEVLENLDSSHVKQVLGRIRHIRSVRWRYCTPLLRSGEYWVPSDVLSSTCQSIHKVQLAIEDLPLQDYTVPSHDAYVKAIPADLLVSLKTESCYPLRTPQLDPLKQLLIASTHLKTFHYKDKGQGTQFSFRAGERLPPIHELELRSYDWNHNAHEANAHWDFSQLQKLVLDEVPLYPFLTSVPPSALRRLRKLECADFNPGSPEGLRASTALLGSLIGQMQELDKLKITCHTVRFPIDALLVHSATLRSLRYQDHIGFAEDDVRCPTMAVRDLIRLADRMHKLQSLELDLDVRLCPGGPGDFLSAICRFPSLQKVILNVQTVVDPFDENVHMYGDRDLEAALAMLEYLDKEKERRQFAGRTGNSASWRQITFKIGGWGPSQLRRLSEAWRDKNRQGIFAERCFVFKRRPADGLYEMDEKYANHADY